MGYNFGKAATSAGLSVLKASPAGQAYSAAKGILSAPGKLLGSIFGSTPTWQRSQTLKNYNAARDQARLGDRDAIEYLARMAGLRRPEFPGTKYPVIRDRARVAYENNAAKWGGRGNSTWAGSNGTARPALVAGRRPVSRMSEDSAPRAPRPCKYGARVEGRCPKAPRRTLSGSRATSGRRKPPCRYGPRDEEGYCPRKSDLGSTYTRRRVERAVESSVKRSATAAIRKISPETKRKLGATAAQVATFAAKATLVGLAGVAAYWITKQLQRVRFKTYQDMRDEVADAYRRSRQEIAASEGRGLTPAEGQQLSAWFKERTARINAAEDAGTPIRSLYNLTFGD